MTTWQTIDEAVESTGLTRRIIEMAIRNKRLAVHGGVLKEPAVKADDVTALAHRIYGSKGDPTKVRRVTIREFSVEEGDRIIEDFIERHGLMSIMQASKLSCVTRKAVNAWIDCGYIGALHYGRNTFISPQEMLDYEQLNNELNVGIEGRGLMRSIEAIRVYKVDRMTLNDHCDWGRLQIVYIGSERFYPQHMLDALFKKREENV